MATRVQINTSKGTVTRTNTSTGESTTSSLAGGSSGRSSSSRSSSSSPKSYVDSSGVIRKEGGTGYKESDYNNAQSSGNIGKSGVIAVGSYSGGSNPTGKSNSTSPRYNPRPSYTDQYGVVRQAPAGTPSSGGSIGGKFYVGATSREIEDEKLAANTMAIEDNFRTRLFKVM